MQFIGSPDGIAYWTTPRRTRKTVVSSTNCDHIDTVCIFCSDPRESLFEYERAQGDNNRPFGD